MAFKILPHSILQRISEEEKLEERLESIYSHTLHLLLAEPYMPQVISALKDLQTSSRRHQLALAAMLKKYES
ncbi:hypothetical protein D6821_02765 [Candidatus Parcubacteria bacterium]|nr:MAG: hypothetical protein D6821_02765 [Candidatus Parcubacteria bacterium]